MEVEGDRWDCSHSQMAGSDCAGGTGRAEGGGPPAGNGHPGQRILAAPTVEVAVSCANALCSWAELLAALEVPGTPVAQQVVRQAAAAVEHLTGAAGCGWRPWSATLVSPLPVAPLPPPQLTSATMEQPPDLTVAGTAMGQQPPSEHAMMHDREEHGDFSSVGSLRMQVNDGRAAVCEQPQQQPAWRGGAGPNTQWCMQPTMSTLHGSLSTELQRLRRPAAWASPSSPPPSEDLAGTGHGTHRHQLETSPVADPVPAEEMTGGSREASMTSKQQQQRQQRKALTADHLCTASLLLDSALGLYALALSLVSGLEATCCTPMVAFWMQCHVTLLP
jgi:hypothetical protein